MDDEKIKAEIEGIVRQYGEDIYLKNKQLVGLISDTIPNDEKIKKLLILAVKNNIPNKILNIKKSLTNDYELELKKLAIKFVDDNSIVTEIGYKTVMLFACGVGLAALKDLIWQDNEANLSEIEPASAVLKDRVQNDQDIQGAKNPFEQYELGCKYYYDDKNYTEAAKCFQKGANEGYMYSQFNLGVCYHNGRGVEQNFVEAAKWYSLSADQGYASAQYNLGILIENGLGQPADYIEALKWYQKAADQGHKKAQESIIRVEAMCTTEERIRREGQRARKALDDISYVFQKRRKIHVSLGLLQILFSFLSVLVLELSDANNVPLTIIALAFVAIGMILFIYAILPANSYKDRAKKNKTLLKRLKTEQDIVKTISNEDTAIYVVLTIVSIIVFLITLFMYVL